MRLRVATAADQATIRRLVAEAGINRMALDWHHFVIAENEAGAAASDGAHGRWGNLLGIGQIKQHGDGSRELASIAVVPEWQGRGIATAIIRHLLEREPGTLYLTCRGELEGFYARFGFQSAGPEEMTPYFRRIAWLARIVLRVLAPGRRMLVMKRSTE
jgi:amino-acid N-acetyltransferase